VVLADTGGHGSVFPAFRELVDGSGRTQGTLEVAVAHAVPFARRVARVTSLEAVVSAGDQVLGSTVGVTPGMKLPASRGIVTASGADYRGPNQSAVGFE